MAEGTLNYGDLILHYTSPENWRACQRSGFVEPKSIPYYDWERDNPQRGVLAYSPYLVGLLNPGGWNRQGLMDELVVRRASSHSGLMILGVPISEMGWAFVREHAPMSPAALNERRGYDLYGKWVSGGQLTDVEKNIVTEARRQYLESSTPLKEYDGGFECPEIWLPNRTPVDEIKVIQDLTGDVKRKRFNQRLAAFLFGAAYVAFMAPFSLYQTHKDRIVTVTPAAALETTCIRQEMNLPEVLQRLEKMRSDSMRRLDARGLNIDEEPMPEELEQSLDDALPHLASVLGTNRVYRPDIEVVERLPPSNYRDAIAMFDVPSGIASFPRSHPGGGLTSSNSKDKLVHEAAHAQALGGNFLEFTELMYDQASGITGDRVGYRKRFLDDHPLVELVTMEVLARQALEGDDLAQFAFAIETREKLSTLLEAAEGSLVSEENYRRPAELIMEMLSCRMSDYRGVRIDGIRKLLGKK